MLKRIVKITGWVIAGLLLLIVGFGAYVRFLPEAPPPVPPSMASMEWTLTQPEPGLLKIKNNWFRRSESGLYELYVEGAPFERGVVIGKLTHDLVQHQEEVFTTQLHRLVPNTAYLSFLKYFIKWFNRNLGDNVTEEYRQEIYGVSQAASHKFDDIGPAYNRMLNYHAAHDIGHALQNISLVGCTSFATWQSQSEDSSLIIGRNFDFYLGDDFGRDKIVAFYRPESGHKFMMVTFGGMTGVLSGMNDKGLTVTINAAKSAIPPGSATPVSLVAREILQYASTAAEAYAIAEKRTLFVSESFLIGSARDGQAVLIEKTPETMDRVNPKNDYIISTNHYLGKPLGETDLNLEHVKTSSSEYRFERVSELLHQHKKNSVITTAAILRDRQGLGGQDIGLGNEKSINQLVAHHSIIFQPEKLRVWISTTPLQMGKYVCYDLNKIFSLSMTTNREIYESALTIPADSFGTSKAYHEFLKFSPYRFPFTPHGPVNPDSLIRWNPESYQAYLLGGDFWFAKGEYGKAIPFYENGLRRESATLPEREHLEKNLLIARQKLK